MKHFITEKRLQDALKKKKNLEGINKKFTASEMMCLKTKTFYF